MLEFIKKILELFVGKKYDRDIKGILPIVESIKKVYPTLEGLSHDELRGKTAEFRQRIKEYLGDIDTKMADIRTKIKSDPSMDPDEKEEFYKEIDELEKEHDTKLEDVLLQILPEAFAVVKETARRFSENETIESTPTQLDRDLATEADFLYIENDKAYYKNSWTAAGATITWNMVHYDVQLIGGIVLHSGKIAEMATGEGKTLVATLPAYLNGLAGKGVHVITVNDYLAKRDSEWMAPILSFLGLTIDCIDKYQPNTARRRKAYECDIVYGTNNEFGFDYLRDNMVRTANEIVQRKLHYAMIDEVDSVLVDDARTPLIISGPVERGDEHEYGALKPRIELLVRNQRELTRKYLIEAKQMIKEGKTDENSGGLALLRAFRGLPRNKQIIKYLSEEGIKKIMLDSENYYMQEQSKRMPEVDADLYFVIEEKQNQVTLTEKGIELITQEGEDQEFFVMPNIGEKMLEIDNADSDDAGKQREKDELMRNFAVKSERIHSVQQLLKAYTLFEKEVEYVVMDDKVKIVDESTGRIMEGRRYSDGLHQAIEAKENVKIEAATQTFATVTLQNFFKMYHKLAGMTGTAETEAGEFWEIYNLDVVVIPTNRPIIRKDQEDLVYRTQREKFGAVIDEVIKIRDAGRPVLIGTTSVETSELLSSVLTRRNITHNVLNAKNHAQEADIVAAAGQPGAITIATNMAGRGTDIKLGEGVIRTEDNVRTGGLAIIGTERHDSRRVDRQLRGRSGRQGDPGSTQFFVSLEDKLMRLFGSDKVARVMDRMGHEDGEAIQHSMITKSIERAQKKVEENNFGIRKRLLDYDEVMNVQRNNVYKKRRHALFGERLTVDIYNMFYDLAEEIVEKTKIQDDYEYFVEEIRSLAINTSIDQDSFKAAKPENLTHTLYEELSGFYKRHTQNIINLAMPVLLQVFAERGEILERVIVPFVSGSKSIQIVANLREAIESQGRSLVKEYEKNIVLHFIDDTWKTHLRQMDELKQSVQTAVHEQKDPLLIYKKEAYLLFREMLGKMNQDITSFLFTARLPQPDPEAVTAARQARKTDLSQLKTSRNDEETEQKPTRPVRRPRNTNAQQAQPQANTEKKKPETYKRSIPKVGRNEICPCGSGKKYKHCHGKKKREEV
ncbi:MAG: preprotein translocase subunit SecA [Chitinophagales bacterium]